jgi:hypothetical protein
MTEAEARRRAEAAAATYYSDNLIGRLASIEAVEVAARALMALDGVSCSHEAYHGRCAHCDAPIVNGRVA